MSSKAETVRQPARQPTEAEGTPSLLLVDDEPAALRVLAKLLERHGYSCQLAGSAEEAKSVLAEGEFELILSDMNMPGGTGIDLLEHVINAYPLTATVMVTGADDPELAEKALLMGAYGYVLKPFRPNEILINVTNALRRRALEIENAAHREHLSQMVQERTQHLWEAIRNLEVAHEDLRSSNEETIEKLSIAAEYRDNETAQHIHRMSSYCELLARKVGFDTSRCETIRMASVMHDVGKIGVPDSILLKPGKLTPEEYDTMKTHAEMGFRVLDSDRSDLLELAATIALTHHEWWDGSGYPRGIKGEEIPIEGRIAAIADVFDALTSNRVYRKAFHLGQAVEMMTQERGTHFDPELLDLFLDSLDGIIVIREAATAE
jgi:putative two-component system response regulator